ncbi:MAG: ABC transporter permease, partial [Gillisia sp.]
MIRNYFKIAWRNLFRNKTFSLTNLLGLTIGMTCSILILLWVNDELSYNKSQENYHQIYQIMANRKFNGQVFTDGSMVLPLAQSIEQEVPQVKYAVATTYPTTSNFAYKEVKLKKTGLSVSPHFFDLFTVDFIKGNKTSALKDPSSVILTESAAKAIFHNEDPINKILRIDNSRNATVSAVVKDMPQNNSVQFDYILPFDSSSELKPFMMDWQNSSWEVYVQTLPGSNPANVQQKINNIKYEHDESDKSISSYFIFPMNKWRLYSDFKDGKNVGGMIEYVRLFSIIAIIILV